MRLLVITNETAGDEVLIETVRFIALHARAEVLVVAPALNSRLRHFVSDEDGARAAARGRVELLVDRLAEAGVTAEGRVGDADPLQAIAGALVTFEADELLIATSPEETSDWLAHDLVERACVRFDVPVAHLPVDVAQRAERLMLAA